MTSRLNAHEMMSATGVSGSLFDYPKLLNHLVIGVGFATPGFLVLAAVAAFWNAGIRTGTCADSDPTCATRFCTLILATACILWLAWVLRAPIAHLRYLWPALALMAILGGIGLSTIHRHLSSRGESAKAAACQLIALGFIFGGMAGTARSLVLGESDYLSWEWSREMGADCFRRFQHVQDQRDAANYLKSEIQDALVLSYFPFSLRYLAGRPLFAAGEEAPVDRREGSPTFLVLTPAPSPDRQVLLLRAPLRPASRSERAPAEPDELRETSRIAVLVRACFATPGADCHEAGRARLRPAMMRRSRRS